MKIRAFALLLLFGAYALPVEAQTIWSRPYEPNQIAIEAIAPETATDGTALTGASFVTGTVSLTESIEANVELPLARFGAPNGGPSSTALGNPYLGLGLSSTRIPLLVQLGTRIPAAPTNEATRVGQQGDMGRGPAFRPEEFVLSGLLNTRASLGRYTTIRLRTGLEFGSATRQIANAPDQVDRTWRLQYDLQWWRQRSTLLTGLTFTGRSTLSSPGNTQHHAALSVMGDWNRVQPGLVAGLSLNDFFRDQAFTPFAGLTLSISYRR